MNIRTASLLTALLFLVAPLAIVTPAEAQFDPETCATSIFVGFPPDQDACTPEFGGDPSCFPDADTGVCFPPQGDPTAIVMDAFCSLPGANLSEACPDAPAPPCTGIDLEVACLPASPPGGGEPGPSPCIAGNAAADPVHDALCALTGQLNTPGTAVTYTGDDDEDGRLDYATIAVLDISAWEGPTDDPGDDCGLVIEEVDTGFFAVPVPTGPDGTGTDCFNGLPVLFYMHVRIDLNAGEAPAQGLSNEPVQGALVILELNGGDPTGFGFFADGHDIVYDSFHVQDPRHDALRYYLVSDLDNDGDTDLTESSCPASGTNPYGTLANPTNDDSTCADPDADGDDRGRVNADGTRNDAGTGIDDSDPTIWDSDGDGQRDNTDPFPLDATNGDPDQDGILTFTEQDGAARPNSPANPYCAPAPGAASILIQFSAGDACEIPGATDPSKTDTDGDGLMDGQETKDTTYMHAASNNDDPHNHLVNCGTGKTVNNGDHPADPGCNGGFRTDPLNPDTDNDGQRDNLDPRRNDPLVQDLDQDGVWDNVERLGTTAGYTSPNLSEIGGPSGAEQVSNLFCSSKTADGASITREAGKPLSGACPDGDAGGVTDTADTDSDGDGLGDFEEITGLYASRLDSNDAPTCFRIEGVESDPNNADTDDDGVTDFSEICPGAGGSSTDPSDPADFPVEEECAPVLGFEVTIFVCVGNEINSLACDWFGVIPPGQFPDCYIGDFPPEGFPGGDDLPGPGDLPTPPCDMSVDPLCAMGGVPGVPSPVDILLNPECHVEDYADEAADTSACETTVGLPANLDSRDLNDVDDDGITLEPNNQIDLVEERFVYFDLDEQGEAAHAERENNADLEGAGPGATVAIWDPSGFLGGRPKEVVRIHVGDAGAEGTPTDLLIVEEGPRGAPAAVSCVYIEGTALKFTFENPGGFDPNAESDPCGDTVSFIESISDQGFLPLSFTDPDHDQIPDTVAYPDFTSPDCPTDPFFGALPDPTGCPFGDPQPIGPGGGLPANPDDLCALDFTGLICVPADPCADEDPENDPAEGCPAPDPCADEDPENDPAEGCGGEPDPCEQDPTAEGCSPECAPDFSNFPCLPAFPPEGFPPEGFPPECPPECGLPGIPPGVIPEGCAPETPEGCLMLFAACEDDFSNFPCIPAGPPGGFPPEGLPECLDDFSNFPCLPGMPPEVQECADDPEGCAPPIGEPDACGGGSGVDGLGLASVCPSPEGKRGFLAFLGIELGQRISVLGYNIYV